MTQRQVTQYRCDFCSKRGYSAGHMRKHEHHCTANPERVCRLCQRGGEQKPMGELIAALKSDINAAREVDLQPLRDLASGCPICILSAIRQSGLQKWDGDPESVPYQINFNFAYELKSWWEEENTAKQAESYYG